MPEDKRYTVEGYWDCQYCGNTGIRGRYKSCPNCGHSRDASVRFYTKEIDADHAITAEEFQRETAEADKNSHSTSANYGGVETAASGGPSLYDREEGQGRGDGSDDHDATDWLCDYCDSYNPATVEVCRNCGAAREQSDGKTYQQVAGTMARTYDDEGNLVKERDLSKKAEAPQPQPEAPARGRFPLIPVLLVGAAVIAALVFLLSPKAQKVTVADFDWQRTIGIEQLQTVQESDWSVPQGGRQTRAEREIRSYDHVLDHYEKVPHEVSEQVLDHYETYTTTVDKGDGTFDVEEHKEPVYKTEKRTEYRDEPVYVDVPIFDTKYTYDIERWVHERDVKTEGKDHDPKWGEVKLSGATGANGTGQEREGQRTGTYGVTDSAGKHYTADEDYWQKLEQGQEIEVFVDRDGHITPKK